MRSGSGNVWLPRKDFDHLIYQRILLTYVRQAYTVPFCCFSMTIIYLFEKKSSTNALLMTFSFLWLKKKMMLLCCIRASSSHSLPHLFKNISPILGPIHTSHTIYDNTCLFSLTDRSFFFHQAVKYKWNTSMGPSCCAWGFSCDYSA